MKLDKYISISKAKQEDVTKATNLCNRFSQDDLDKISGVVSQGFDYDNQSRYKWEQRMGAAMDLAMQVQSEKTFPWPGAANVVFPLVTIAALQFSTKSYANIVSGTDLVKYRVIGEDENGEKTARADRISTHMSWQLLEQDTSWEEQQDRLLINLAIVGTNFKKTYFSPTLGHNVNELVMARDLVLNYWAKSVDECARKTHIIPLSRNDIYERVHSGVFSNVLNEGWYTSSQTSPQPTPPIDNRRGTNPPTAPDADTPFKVLEQHCLLDLDNDGYAEPYIVTIAEQSRKILRIVARWERVEDIERTQLGAILRIRPMEYFTKYSFIPAPDGGIYDVGFGILLGPLNESVNSAINQLLDAGTMANSAGGFLGKGAKMRGGTLPMAPWEWRRVDSTGDDLRKNMVPLPVREPGAVMFQLLGLLINYTDRVAGTTDMQVGINPGQNTPAETSRNTHESGAAVYSSIFKRVWRSMKEEFKKNYKLNSIFMNQKEYFGEDGKSFAKREDYLGNSDLVVPVADPSIVSAGMRFSQAQAIREAAATTLGYDRDAVEINFLKALRVQNIKQIFPGSKGMQPPQDAKVTIEQIKADVKMKEVEYQKWEFTQELMEARRINNAKIVEIEANAQSILNDITITNKEHHLKAFDTAVQALKSHNDVINDRIALHLEQRKVASDGGSATGSVPGLASRSVNAGVSSPIANLATGLEDSMGGDAVPG